MKAIGYQDNLPCSDPHALLDFEQDKPTASERNLLVKVEAISVNPVDTKIRRAAKPEVGETKILGWDAVGTVEAIGSDVTFFKPGDRVWYAGALDKSGSNAEYQLVDERIVAQAPTSLSDEDAAALPLTAITAWELLFDRFALNKDSQGSLLIIGAAGGVGSMMIQLAKQLTNMTIIASASRPETKAWVTQMGADYVIDHRQALSQEMEALYHQHPDIAPPSFIAGLTHTEHHLPDIIEIIAPQGHFGLIDDMENFNVMPFKPKSVAIHWEFMFTRSLFQTDDMQAQHHLLTELSRMIDAGTIKTTIAHRFGEICAENLLKAHQLLESGKSKGKIVLSGF